MRKIIFILSIFISMSLVAEIYFKESGDTWKFSKESKNGYQSITSGRLLKELPYGDLIYTNSRKYKLDPILVHAMIMQESAYQERAVSHAGAIGLMQIMPFNFIGDSEDLKIATINVERGTQIMMLLLRKYDNDLTLALSAYNAGEAVVDHYKNIPPYPETIDYVQRVLTNYENLTNEIN